MVVNAESFRRVLSRARTFCFESDIEPLRGDGTDSRRIARKRDCADKDGMLNGPLRYADEFGRHKALDLIGDLALVGLPLLGRVEARKGRALVAHAAGEQVARR